MGGEKNRQRMRVSEAMRTPTRERASFPSSSARLAGTYHSVSEAHLHRYLAGFDFRYNNRSALALEESERAAKAPKGAEDNRLMYNQSR